MSANSIAENLANSLSDGRDSASVLTELAALASQMAELRATGERQAQSVAENTDALGLNTMARDSSSGSALANAGKAAGNFLTSGFGLSPLVTGLFHLFGGGGSDPQEIVYPRVERPQPIQAERSYAGQSGPAQITIQVQAMDSRSFLDHSEDIARAVRSAMLNSSSLNDVVSEI